MTEQTTEAILVLDAHTLKDLEVFSADNDLPSLFDYCNLTRFDGGARVLRRRMASPSADAEKIQATQDSIRFIMANRELFTKMPSAYAANKVDHYFHEVLPIALKEQALEFGLEVLSLWLNHDRHYSAISLGVQMTCRYLRLLKEFVAIPELGGASGELKSLLGEIQTLLALPRITSVPEYSEGSSPWRLIKLDQVFRLHEKSHIARLQELLHEIDALVSLADVTAKQGLVLPDVETGPLRVSGEGIVHPFVDQAVGNPVQLDQSQRLLFLTGPNMAGKTTYLRAFATAVYFGHLGMGVPARSFRFVPAERLFSSISLTDDLRGGVSYFRAEALRVKAIAEAVASGKKVVALMDEPFKGTNVKDALDASQIMLERFSEQHDCLFMFSSHLIELAEILGSRTQIDCRYFQAETSVGRLNFDFTLRAGVSDQRLGMRVLEEEGVFELLSQKD